MPTTVYNLDKEQEAVFDTCDPSEAVKLAHLYFDTKTLGGDHANGRLAAKLASLTVRVSRFGVACGGWCAVK